MARVKVCGQTREADVAASVAAGADAIGVIVDVPVDTPREVDRDTAASLLDAVPPFVTSVLVTMPESAAAVGSLLADLDPDAVQIHAGLGIAGLEAVTEMTDLPVLIGAGVEESAAITDLAELGDALLLDSRDESGAGGTGRVPDWKRANEIRAAVETPVILAGGLTPENVGDGIAAVDPFAVDVATGVESRGGVKDHEAVERFVEAARGGVGVGA